MKKRHAAAGLVVAALACGPALPAHALTFEPNAEGDVIRARGPIVPGDTDRLRQLLRDDVRYRLGQRTSITLDLESPGGSVLSGIELTNFVRANNLNTHIARGNGCYSACTFVAMGGVKRTILGEFGIHAMAKRVEGGVTTYSDRDLAGVQQLASTLISLALTMVGDSRVIAAMLNTPNETIHVVPDKDLVAWRIITDASRPTQRMKASFDCTARNLPPTEAMVCDSLVLSDKDLRLATAYEWLAKNDIVKDLAAEHDTWKKHRASCLNVVGPDTRATRIACVNTAYDVRLRQLEGLVNYHQASKTPPASNGWKEHSPTQDLTKAQPPQQ